MAVCGRCLICGHKFSCDREDEAIRWACNSESVECAGNREHSHKAYGEAYEHAICVWCHDALLDHKAMQAEIEVLLVLVQLRSEKLKHEDGIGD